MKSISKECNLFKDCPFNWDCLLEIALTGSALWSIEICYDLKALIDSGLIAIEPSLLNSKIQIGMLSLFGKDMLLAFR